MTAASEIEQLLKSYAERTGFPLDELNRLRAKRQAERPRLFDSQAAAAAFKPNAEDLAFRQTLEKRRELLRSLPPPTTLITLDHPDTIELFEDQFPVTLFEQSIEPFLSIALLIVSVGSFPHSSAPRVTATYRWTNPSPNLAIINVGTLLRFTGAYDVTANAGFFDGNTNHLDISADLNVIINGENVVFGGNTHQTVLQTEASGGSIFGGGDDEVSGSYSALPVGLGADFIPVPGSTEVAFVVDLTVNCRLDSDASLGDQIDVDFGSSTDTGLRRIAYPFLHVEVLTS